jgi:hypothetical protein
MPETGGANPVPSERIVGVPWYAREDYPEVLALMEDAHTLARDYDQWLIAAQSNEAEARRAGVRVLRVPVEPAAFARWCADRGVPRTRTSRVEFVNASMRRDASDE